MPFASLSGKLSGFLAILAVAIGFLAFPARGAAECAPEDEILGLICLPSTDLSIEQKRARRVTAMGAAEKEALLRRAKAETSVAFLIESIRIQLGRGVVQDSVQHPSELALALRDSRSNEAQFYGQYLRYLSARRPSDYTHSETAESLGFSNLDTYSLLDKIVMRLTLEGKRIPEELTLTVDRKAIKVRPLDELTLMIQGGLERVDARAGSHMLNESLGDLHDLERDMSRPESVPIERIFASVHQLAKADGSGFFPFQPARRDGEHYPFRQVIEPEAHALALPEGSQLVVTSERSAMHNIAEQSPEFRAAVARIEAKLALFPPGSPEHQAKLEAYRAFQRRAIYKSADLEIGGDMLGRLAVAVVEHGTVSDCEDYERLLYDWLQATRDNLWKDPGRRRVVGQREVFAELLALVNARERWDQPTLRFVLDQMKALAADLGEERMLAPERAQAMFEEIKRVRYAETPDAGELNAFFKSAVPGAEPQRVNWGTFSFKLSVKSRSVAGLPQKTLVLAAYDAPERDYYGEPLSRFLAFIEQSASEHGYQAFEISRLTNTHHASWLDSNRSDLTRINLWTRWSRNIYDEVPTYYKSFTPLTPDESHVLAEAIEHAYQEAEAGRRKDFEEFREDNARNEGQLIPLSELPPPAALPLPDGNLAHDLALVAQVIRARKGDYWGGAYGGKIGIFSPGLLFKTVHREGRDLKILELASVSSDRPGSGSYPEFLHGLERVARESGLDGFQVEGVTDPGQIQFYEKKMGYEVVSGKSARRVFLLDFSKPRMAILAACVREEVSTGVIASILNSLGSLFR